MKNCLITGVSKGLGLMIATKILSEGGVVVNISRSRNNEIIDLENKYPQNFFSYQFDLSDVEHLKEFLKSNIFCKIKFNSFINNAAIAYDDIVTNINLLDLRKMYDVNVFSPFIIVKYFIRQCLLNNINGSIVHLSSISVHTGYKGLSMYASTKGALEAFSRNTSREWAEKGIRSNCIVAGFMETNMTSILSKEKITRIRNRTSQKELTDLNSVASTISFLISEDSRSITGSNIFVDSGTI
jgi:3-oxoacyl-[acyl-carrier protein] reductase